MLHGYLATHGKDLDFDQRQLMVRQGKGAKDRATLLPDRRSGIPTLNLPGLV